MSNSAAAEEPPQKKGKTSPPPSSSSYSPLSSLPDELILNCLARVSRSDQASLSLVSKYYRSLMASPEFHNTRSLLGFTENSVYVCFLTPTNQTPNWFILAPNRILRPIPSLPSQATEGSSVLALDSGIYVIGGRLNGKRTSNVGFLDCRTHKWRKLPLLWRLVSLTGRFTCLEAAGKQIRRNGRKCSSQRHKLGVTLTSIPDREMLRYYLHDSVVVNDEKVYGVGAVDDTLYYSPSEGKWGRGFNPPRQGNRRDWCVIDENLIVCIDFNGNLCWSEIKQLETEEMTPATKFWKEVKGLGSMNETLCSSRLSQLDRILEAMWESYKITIGKVEMLIDFLPGARLCSSNSGSNILLFWDVVIEEEGDRSRRLEIWCAEISMERRCQGAEIWGNVEWSNVVMTVDPFVDHYKVLCSVSVTL